VDAVTEAFAVSRIPVREALIRLVGEGLVDHVPRAGYTVAQLTRDELSQFYAVREALEAAGSCRTSSTSSRGGRSALRNRH
jgi:DNA-binding GntR family transcriptional regulator